MPSAIALAITSISKQGNVSPSWAGQRVEEMGLQASCTFTWTREEVFMFWHHFGSQIRLTEEEWELFFETSSESIPVLQNRLKLVCDQAKFAGMTTYNIISNVRRTHDRFPWPQFERLVGEQGRWPLFEDYCREHPYLMFTREGATRTETEISQVPGLLYLCIQLIKVNNPTSSLSNYRGLENVEIPKKRTIEHWVQEYVLAIDASETQFPGIQDVDFMEQ